jgi:hypothetical protein
MMVETAQGVAGLSPGCSALGGSGYALADHGMPAPCARFT